VRGGDGLDAAREDLRKLGVQEGQVAQQLGAKNPTFEVWPENWPAVQAFLKVQTQWATGMGGPTGLDYTRVRDGLELAGVSVTPELFEQLQVMEAGALKAFSERTPKAKT
jgi:hypothetical protein